MARNFLVVGLALGLMSQPLRAVDSPELQKFLFDLKPGTFLIVELRDGSVTQGRLVEYSDYDNTLYLEPAGEPGYFNRKSYRLSTIATAHVATPQEMRPSEGHL